MALVDNSLICWRMAGWEKIHRAQPAQDMNRMSARASCNRWRGGFDFHRKHPRRGKTFINRPPVTLWMLAMHRSAARVLAVWFHV